MTPGLVSIFEVVGSEVEGEPDQEASSKNPLKHIDEIEEELVPVELF